MTKKQKYYVVWKGRQTGIFSSWDECSAQVAGFSGAEYKAFEDKAEAERAFSGQYGAYKGKTTTTLSEAELRRIGKPIIPSYSVDASCIGNPGILEYRCVNTKTGEIIFKQGPFQQGTNNVGEFLAIVHALVICKQKAISWPIYSDSRNAIGWVKEKKCKTNLVLTDQNKELFDLIQRAENWLENNTVDNKILKWETEAWGEVPADYGRK